MDQYAVLPIENNSSGSNTIKCIDLDINFFRIKPDRASLKSVIVPSISQKIVKMKQITILLSLLKLIKTQDTYDSLSDYIHDTSFGLDLGKYKSNKHLNTDNEDNSPNTHNLQWTRSKEPPMIPERKNIVVLMADDQDAVFNSISVMTKTNTWLSRQGLTMNNAFVTTPICCPSRSSYLTGKYMHNHGVSTNNQECCSESWRQHQEPKTFNNYLKKYGNYYTSYIGKYMNEYNGKYVPQGWDYWTALHKNSKYYNYTLARSVNGEKITEERRGDKPEDYFSYVIADEVETSIKKYRRKMRKLKDNHLEIQPLLMYLAFPAPHGVEHAPLQFQHEFLDQKEKLPHRTDPSYNLTGDVNKNWFLKSRQPLTQDKAYFTDILHVKRLQTLLALDQAIDRIMETFKKRKGMLENTYFVYTSDHGYHMGQFGLPKGKSLPYDFDSRVPFIIRGPGIKANSKLNLPISNIDLAPTILDLADVFDKVQGEIEMDGRSMKPIIFNNNKSFTKSAKELLWKDTILIERGKDLPEVTKTIPDKPEKLNKYQELEKICGSNEYRDPCMKGQDWYCTKSLNTKEEAISKGQFYSFRVRKCKRATRGMRLKPELEVDFTTLNTTEIQEIFSNAEKIQLLNQNNCACQECECKKNNNMASSRGVIVNGKCQCVKRPFYELTDLDPDYLKTALILKNKQKSHSHRKRSSRKMSNSSRMARSIVHGVGLNTPSKQAKFIQNAGLTSLDDSRHTVSTNSQRFTIAQPQMRPSIRRANRYRNHPRRKHKIHRYSKNDSQISKNPNFEPREVIQAREHKITLDKKYQKLIQKYVKTNFYLSDDDYLQKSCMCPNSEKEVEEEYSSLEDDFEDEDDIEITGSDLDDLDALDDLIIDDSKRSFREEDFKMVKINRKSKNSEVLLTGDENLSLNPLVKLKIQANTRKNDIEKWKDNYGRRKRNKQDAEKCSELKINPQILPSENNSTTIIDTLAPKITPTCSCSERGMKCSRMGSFHWKTRPFYERDDFCFCQSASNNTYQCLRTINEEDNYLFCAFTTEELYEYYDYNRGDVLNRWLELGKFLQNKLIALLKRMVSCDGAVECNILDGNTVKVWVQLK